jgi:hypothetical protein
MYWITQYCDYDVLELNYALSNKWFWIWIEYTNKQYNYAQWEIYCKGVHIFSNAKKTLFFFANKNVDIQFNAHDPLLE